uniref:Ig-like domain-containing protein n=1 Tax=Esox lucius TaxID=8010 RepID=A0A6Q2XA68_ESOLU
MSLTVKLCIFNCPYTGAATLTVDPNIVFPGEKVTLTCSVESDRDWTEYEWYKDNKINRYRLYEHSGATFTINSVTVSDQGSYQCQGNRQHRPTSTSSSNLVTITVQGDLDTLLCVLCCCH